MCWLFEDERLNVEGIQLKDLNVKFHAPEGWTPENSQHIHFKE